MKNERRKLISTVYIYISMYIYIYICITNGTGTDRGCLQTFNSNHRRAVDIVLAWRTGAHFYKYLYVRTYLPAGGKCEIIFITSL